MSETQSGNVVPATLFTTVPIDLFRMGNAGGPRLDRVRLGKDVGFKDVVLPSGVTKRMVSPDGGVSTFDAKNPTLTGVWWKIPAGVRLPETIRVTKDHGAWNQAAGCRITHYSFRPSRVMTIEEYAEGLRDVATSAVQEPKPISAPADGASRAKGDRL
jgi:hypothetical protein